LAAAKIRAQVQGIDQVKVSVVTSNVRSLVVTDVNFAYDGLSGDALSTLRKLAADGVDLRVITYALFGDVEYSIAQDSSAAVMAEAEKYFASVNATIDTSSRMHATARNVVFAVHGGAGLRRVQEIPELWSRIQATRRAP
jgi:hypothetical protein